MTKTRELFMIMAGITLLVAAIWFWAYFRPSSNRVAQIRIDTEERENELNATMEAARVRRRIHEELTERHRVLSAEWREKAANLPQRFDDRAVLRHIQYVIYPHTEEIELSFDVSERREYDLLYSTVVTLEFETSYWQFLAILHNLIQGDLGNRVVNYTLEVSPMEESDFVEMRTNVAGGRGAGYIPEHIRHVFVTNEIDPIGLHMLSVEMEVEYLSIEPGLLSEAEWRTIWELEELLLNFVEDLNIPETPAEETN
jgi:hypothetical protein